MWLRIPTALSLLSAMLVSAAAAAQKHSHLPLPSRTIFQFGSNGTWIENIAVRPNGDLLLTMLAPNASLYTLKRPYSSYSSPVKNHEVSVSLVHAFDPEEATSLLGITELSDDRYAVVSFTSLPDGSIESGSTRLWVVSPSATVHGEAWDVKKVASLPDVIVPNGITAVSPGIVLVADSIGGSLTRCDIRVGKCARILSGPELAPVSADKHIGINGVHHYYSHHNGIREGWIYWSNSGLASIYRRRIDEAGYPVANSTSELVGAAADSVQFVDDFTMDVKGRLWMATYTSNALVVLGKDGKKKKEGEIIVGGPHNDDDHTDDTVAGCTAAAFGRTALDGRVLYVVTSGGDGAEPAKVVAVDTSSFRS